MAASTRLLATLALLSAALGAVAFAWPTWSDDLLSGGSSLRPATIEVAPRDRNHEVVVARVKAKQRIVRALLDGELTLIEAAGWFRYLNRTPEGAPARGWEILEGRCEGEKMCRQVISWVNVHMTATATESQRDAKLRALEVELAEHIARHGRVMLQEM